MSYAFTVNVKDGKPSFDETTNAYYGLPDGRFMVSGHVPDDDPNTWRYESMTITRYDAANTMAAQANMTSNSRKS